MQQIKQYLLLFLVPFVYSSFEEKSPEKHTFWTQLRIQVCPNSLWTHMHWTVPDLCWFVFSKIQTQTQVKTVGEAREQK